MTWIGWQGATHQFKKLTPEMFQRIPQKGYVRFEMGLLVREERNQDGQMIILQIPTLVSVLEWFGTVRIGVKRVSVAAK
ncbi:MAG: hypothetical protein LBI05_05525 [Planctomycetaceae bacterium]|nr:hypothetical protein [Planctomycetaceae bacterium]